jgi:NAD-dependent dihydropyrimidine dehydrogenase PreA subunit
MPQVGHMSEVSLISRRGVVALLRTIKVTILLPIGKCKVPVKLKLCWHKDICMQYCPISAVHAIDENEAGPQGSTLAHG